MKLLEYFSYDPATGMDFHETASEACKAAEMAIDDYRDHAGDGWNEAVTEVCYGKVLGMATEYTHSDYAIGEARVGKIEAPTKTQPERGSAV